MIVIVPYDWNMRRGSEPAVVNVDGHEFRTIADVTQKQFTIVLPLEFYGRIANGQKLEIGMLNISHPIDLAGIDQALNVMIECVERHL